VRIFTVPLTFQVAWAAPGEFVSAKLRYIATPFVSLRFRLARIPGKIRLSQNPTRFSTNQGDPMLAKLAALTVLSLLPALAQQGALVYSKSGDAWIMNTDGSNQTRLTTTGGVSIVRLSTNVLVYLAGGQLHRSTLQGFGLSTPPQPIPNTAGVLEFDLSPDGSKIVLAYFAGSNTTLYTMNTDGTSLTAINSGSLHQGTICWGRDGSIYFVQSSIGNALSQILYRIPENGVNNPVALTNYFSQYPAAGAPGDRVAFLYQYPVKLLRTMNADGSNQQDVPGLNLGDGGYIAVDYFNDYIYYPLSAGIGRVRQDGSGNQMLASGGILNFVDYGTLTIDNTAPVVTSVTSTPNPASVNTTTTLAATFTDAGGSGLALAQYTLDGGAAQWMGTLSGDSGSLAIPIAAFPTAGVHNLCVRAQDMAGNVSDYSCTLLAVYDPAGGFVTGGGWIPGAPGGKSNFGLVAKYQQNNSVPTGKFEFHPGSNKFKSTSLAWLVISGNVATVQGNGEWNGAPGYLFQLTASDSAGNDQLAVRIWNGSGTVLDVPLTGLGGGQIVIH
jgi:hypothetical protein